MTKSFVASMLFAICLAGLPACGGGAGDTPAPVNPLIQDYHYEQVSAAAEFSARDGAGLLAFKSSLFLIGGWSQTSGWPFITANDIWRLPGGSSVWSELKPNTYGTGAFNAARDWEGRHTAGYLVHNGRMWLLGGDYNSGHYQSDVWNSVDGSHWTRVAASTPIGDRVLFHTFVLNGWMYVFGGQRIDPAITDYESSYHRDGWRTRDGVNWQHVLPDASAAGLFPSGLIQGSVVKDGYVYIVGGGYYPTAAARRAFRNDVWRSRDAVTWERVTAEAPWAARHYHSVAVYKGRMFVIAGYYRNADGLEQNIGDVWYSVDGANWHPLPGQTWSIRHAPSVAVHDGALYVTAGTTARNDVGAFATNDVHRLIVLD